MIEAEELVALGIEDADAREQARRVNELIDSLPAGECWRRISTEILTPRDPFELHSLLYHAVFRDWDDSQGPPSAWAPSAEYVEATNIGSMMNELGIDSYRDFHAWSVAERERFWEMIIDRLGIRFEKRYGLVGDMSDAESPRWLVDAELNIADSCFRSPEDAPAIAHQEEGSPIATVTYGELESLSNRVANGLAEKGYRPGDAIACCMPMTAESVAVYIGIVRAGCAVVSIADSFAPDEVEKRLRIADAKGMFTQDVVLRAGKSLPLYEKAVEAGAPPAVVLPASGSVGVELRDCDIEWDMFLSEKDRFTSVVRRPDDYTNVLFSSGTTGDPKAIPWTQTTPIKCAADGWLHHDIRPGDVVCWPTSLGWMMGPWLIYASLVNKATIALYGGTPAGREFATFVKDARVTMLGVVPSLVKAWKEKNVVKGLDWSSIRAFSSTGECSNTEDYLYLMSLAGYRPVIEYCGGTEIGGGYITGTVVQPASPATFSTPALGLDFVLLDEEGRETENGEVFLVPPSIGLSNELMNRDHHEVYFEGTPAGPGGAVLRRHGDQIERLGGDYFRAHGRVDDTMNLGGIKVSSAEIERVLGAMPGVRETAAVAVSPEEEGPSMLVIYAVLEKGAGLTAEDLKAGMQGEIKKHLNPLFHVHDVVITDSLPRTASNKVMHRLLRDRYGREEA
jgi:acetyl-CoA synthetase